VQSSGCLKLGAGSPVEYDHHTRSEIQFTFVICFLLTLNKGTHQAVSAVWACLGLSLSFRVGGMCFSPAVAPHPVEGQRDLLGDLLTVLHCVCCAICLSYEIEK
jgi:hypothetical protein